MGAPGLGIDVGGTSAKLGIVDGGGRIVARACAQEDPGALQVQRAGWRHPRVSATAFFRHAGIDAAAQRGAYPAAVGRGRVVAELPPGEP